MENHMGIQQLWGYHRVNGNVGHAWPFRHCLPTWLMLLMMSRWLLLRHTRLRWTSTCLIFLPWLWTRLVLTTIDLDMLTAQFADSVQHQLTKYWPSWCLSCGLRRFSNSAIYFQKFKFHLMMCEFFMYRLLLNLPTSSSPKASLRTCLRIFNPILTSVMARVSIARGVRATV